MNRVTIFFFLLSFAIQNIFLIYYGVKYNFGIMKVLFYSNVFLLGSLIGTIISYNV